MKKNHRFKSVFFRTDAKLNRIVVTMPLQYKEIKVPAGYVSDGLTKMVNKYQPRCLRAAVIHDFNCENKVVSRKRGDRYFLEILKADGVSRFKRYRYYVAVRAYAIGTLKK